MVAACRRVWRKVSDFDYRRMVSPILQLSSGCALSGVNSRGIAKLLSLTAIDHRGVISLFFAMQMMFTHCPSFVHQSHHSTSLQSSPPLWHLPRHSPLSLSSPVQLPFTRRLERVAWPTLVTRNPTRMRIRENLSQRPLHSRNT